LYKSLQKDFGISQSNLGAIVVRKFGEVANKFLDLVLGLPIFVTIAQAERSVAAMLTMLFGFLGFVKPRHDSTSLGRNCPYVRIMVFSFCVSG